MNANRNSMQRASRDDQASRRQEINYEFKNLLMIISSNAEIVERHTQDSNVRRCLAHIETATGRAAALVRRLENWNEE